MAAGPCPVPRSPGPATVSSVARFRLRVSKKAVCVGESVDAGLPGATTQPPHMQEWGCFCLPHQHWAGSRETRVGRPACSGVSS